jgi:CRP-like cAMP-binding protein
LAIEKNLNLSDKKAQPGAFVTQERKYKRGDVILAEGDVPAAFSVIQSGKVSVYLVRGEQRSEIEVLGPGQIIGDQGVFGFPKSSYSYEAQAEVRVIEIPIEPIKTVFDKSPAPYKLFVKALGEDLRRFRASLKSVKMDQESGPCPYRFIPRLTAILTLVAKNSGFKPKLDVNIPAYKMDEERAKNPHFRDTDLILSYTLLKIYTSRMFLESHQRMQSFCELLAKLGYITLRYEKNEETEQQELVELRIHDTQTIEHFGEFYQHNLFKAGKAEVIYIDKSALQVANAITQVAATAEAGRNNIVKLEYQNLLKELKEKFFVELKETHILLLEKKGLYVKRQTIDEKVYFSFDRYEFQQTVRYWQIIQEIDRWNEKGFVDLNTNYNEYKSQNSGGKCPSCQLELKQASKFCGECGYKLAA